MGIRKKPPVSSDIEQMIRQVKSRCPQVGEFNRLLLERLQIPWVGPGRQFLRRGDGTEPVEFFPDRCWSITAKPSFDRYGMFAVFESRTLIRCAFACKGDLPDKPDVDWAVADCFFEIAEWSDPVLEILTDGPLAPVPDRSQPEGMMYATLDGIGYELEVVTAEVNARLQFSNPRGKHFRSLEKAACDLACRVAGKIKHPQVSSFVNTWRGYVRHG